MSALLILIHFWKNIYNFLKILHIYIVRFIFLQRFLCVYCSELNIQTSHDKPETQNLRYKSFKIQKQSFYSFLCRLIKCLLINLPCRWDTWRVVRASRPRARGFGREVPPWPACRRLFWATRRLPRRGRSAGRRASWYPVPASPRPGPAPSVRHPGSIVAADAARSARWQLREGRPVPSVREACRRFAARPRLPRNIEQARTRRHRRRRPQGPRPRPRGCRPRPRRRSGCSRRSRDLWLRNERTTSF